MKIKATLIATATAFALITGQSSARAGDETIAAIGGFIGGVIVGSIASDNHHGSSVVIETGYGRHSNRHYDRGDRRDRYDRGHGYGRNNRRGHTGNRGRWEYRTVRKWVPGYWSYTRDRCGDRRRFWNRGRHVRTQVRVWVSFGGGHGGSRRHRG